MPLRHNFSLLKLNLSCFCMPLTQLLLLKLKFDCIIILKIWNYTQLESTVRSKLEVSTSLHYQQTNTSLLHGRKVI